ncbi:MAG: pyridoxal 5'-phosphate synthase glutaminase subunit PdxT [Deltaproteobacteria bacterium]|nr:pyridoxal 5'-phosphate synthase glutaminase subunit PdxT [Deltaproteobacteria bacterium]
MPQVGQGAKPRAGVLGIQGAFQKHLEALERAGAEARLVLHKEDLDGLDALVLPGGESTTMAKGLDRLGLYEPIQAWAHAGGRILGTCAGAILLARSCQNHPVRTLGLIDLRAARNAYGSQVDSFTAVADAVAAPGFEAMRCIFIRAPQLETPGPAVEVLLRVDGLPVLARERNVLVSTFHPELGDDLRVHRALLFD